MQCRFSQLQFKTTDFFKPNFQTRAQSYIQAKTVIATIFYCVTKTVLTVYFCYECFLGGLVIKAGVQFYLFSSYVTGFSDFSDPFSAFLSLCDISYVCVLRTKLSPLKMDQMLDQEKEPCQITVFFFFFLVRFVRVGDSTLNILVNRYVPTSASLRYIICNNKQFCWNLT